MAEAKAGYDLSHFDIKITVESIGIEIIINTKDPLDCVVIAGQIASILRASGPVKIQGWDKEPVVKILP